MRIFDRYLILSNHERARGALVVSTTRLPTGMRTIAPFTGHIFSSASHSDPVENSSPVSFKKYDRGGVALKVLLSPALRPFGRN